MRYFKNNFKFVFVFILFFLFEITQAAPTVNITPATQTVNAGQNAIVKITTTGANKCTVIGGPYNNNNISLNGNILLRPTQTTTFAFSCTDVAGESTTARATVTVIGQVTQPVQNVNNQVPTQNNSTQNTNPLNSIVNSAAQSLNNQNQTGGTRPTVQYGNQTIMNEANSICSSYSGAASVYSAGEYAGGFATVPTELPGLIPVLKSIEQNTRLTANEMRQSDLIRLCRELPNMAKASNKLAENVAKQLKTTSDTCVADQKCYLKKVYDADLEQTVERLQQIPVVGRQVAQMILKLNNPEPRSSDLIDYQLQQECSAHWKAGRDPFKCWGVYTDAELYDKIYYEARNEILTNQAYTRAEFERGLGIIGDKPCVRSYSGADPSKLFYKDRDCADYKIQPAAINQEVLRQITALPFTQAYSPANVLGVDQNIENISTRIRNGNLIDPDISNTLGSVSSGGGVNPITGGGSITSGVDLKSVEPNYTKLMQNVGVMVNLYEVTRLAYASSTSVCKSIPVATRAETIKKIEAAKKSYTDYAAAIKNAWTKAQSTPKENHINLVTQINLDLKDKYSQEQINKVYEAAKKLLQACVDAAAGSNSNSNSSPSL